MIYNFTVPPEDQKIIDLIKPDIVNGPWIAGGAVMKWVNGESVGTKETQDVDVWFRNQEQLTSLGPWLELNHMVCKLRTDNAVTMVHSPGGRGIFFEDRPESGYPAIQLIKLNYFESAQEIIDCFDFTCCQFATDGKQIVYNEQSMADLKSKTLHLNPKRKDYTKIINRMLKYAAYGFEPSEKLLHYISKNKKNIDTNFARLDCYDHVV